MRVAAILACVMAVGCVSPAGVSPAVEMEARNFEAPPGMGRLYIYRTAGFYGSGELVSIDVGSVSGALAPASFMIADLEPGSYQIRARANILHVGQTSIRAGQIQFVRISYGLGVKEVTPEKGRQAIEHCWMTWTNQLGAGGLAPEETPRLPRRAHNASPSPWERDSGPPSWEADAGD